MASKLIFERLGSPYNDNTRTSKEVFDLITLFVATEIYSKADHDSYEDAHDSIVYGVCNPHDGDCTGKPYTCFSCYADDYITMARRFIKEIPQHD